MYWPNRIDDTKTGDLLGRPLPEGFDPEKPFSPPSYEYVNLYQPPWDTDNIPTVAPGKWTEQSLRCGALGTKVGMMAVWNIYGAKEICTVVKLQDCQVIQVKKFAISLAIPSPTLYSGKGT